MKPIKLKGKCPGPGFGRRCSCNGEGTPRGGRSRECRLENMRLSSRFKHKTLNGKGSRMSRSERTSAWGAAQRLAQAEEMRMANEVKAQTFGLKGALKVHEAMLRAV